MSKSGKKSKGNLPTIKSSNLFTEEDKGPHVVIVADLNAHRFDPLSRTTPQCLLPLAGVPLLQYSLTHLISDGFRNIIVYACSHAAKVNEFIESFQVRIRKKNVRIYVHNGEGCRTLGDLMRDLDASQALRGIANFLLVPADLICAVPLFQFVRKHEDRCAQNPLAILSLVMPHASKLVTPVQAAEWLVSVLFSPSMDNRIIKLFPTCMNPAPNILLQELARTDLPMELASDLFDLGVIVCSRHIAPLFQDNFDYQTMGDLIHDVLTNEEVMGYTMHIDHVPPGPLMLCAAPDLYTMINFTPYLLMRESGLPLLLSDSLSLSDQDTWVAYGPQVYVARSARVHPTARLIGTCVIGPGCRIDAAAVLVDCAFGADCHIGKSTRLRRVIAMDSIELGDCVRADIAWICSQAVVLSGMRLPTRCFIGPSTDDGPRVTLGPGPGRLSPGTVIVAPCSNDIVLDPAVGGDQVWAALCTGKPRLSGQASMEDFSDDSDAEMIVPNMMVMDQRPLGNCALWDTAEDRIRFAHAKLRQSRSRARGQSSTSDQVLSQPYQRVTSGKLTRKSGRTVSTAGTDIDRLSGPSEDEGEQSEAFLVAELRHTLEHSQGTNSEENVILEVNSLKHAYNIPIEDLYFLLTKALLDLARIRCPTPLAEVEKSQVRTFVSEFKAQLARFEPVLCSYFGHSVQASRMCLQALEDSACYNPLLMEASPYVVHAMYDSDLITEDAIWWWIDHSPLLADDDLSESTKVLRAKLKPFLTWLHEAESEDEDEEDDDQ